LDTFARLIADPSAQFTAVDTADLRIKKLSAERAFLMEELRLAEFETPDKFGEYLSRTAQRPTREIVLDVLDELKVPVPPRVISEYCMATLNLGVPATRFGSLRRDEERAYARDSYARPAWVVPGVNSVGLSPIPRLVASSAWEPECRIIAARTLRVNHLKVLLALIQKANQTNGTSNERLLALTLRFAAWIPAENKTLDAISAAARSELSLLEPDDLQQRKASAEQLARLPVQFQLWGRPGLLEGGKAENNRAIR
jgi:hypothetical protein